MSQYYNIIFYYTYVLKCCYNYIELCCVPYFGAEVEITFIYKVLSIYPASTYSNKKQHHLTSLTSYHIATAKRLDCIKG